ncbi:MAG: LysE family transporter [Spirochaetes bacterium]|jgi:threonine/homoserine/homoserine lactone efflux protein|nr:LysE family transporter [Spirochaetota bacterium]
MNWVIYSKFAVLIGFSMFLGFLSAIPVGAVQVDVAKKAINGHLFPALAVAAGSVTSDFIYGTLTLFGIGHFLVLKQSQIIIYSLGILVLSFLLYRSYREYRHVCHPEDSPLVYKKRFSFLTGFSIAITNPGIIIWWVIGFKLFIDLSVFTEITMPIKLIFILGGCTGLGGYLIFIAYVLHRMGKAFPEKYIDRMQVGLMVLLVVLIGYFGWQLFSIAYNYTQPVLSQF